MSRHRLLSRLFSFISHSYIIFQFVASGAGKSYGIGHLQKLELALRIIRNSRMVTSLTSWENHLQIVEEIFRISPSLEGAVVECGCYNGAMTVNLSLACALTSRKLIVCDSFEGLPRPDSDEKYDVFIMSNEYYLWEEGNEKSDEGLDGVKKTVEKLGRVEVCEFVNGYFKDTLKDIAADSIVLVFEDAALRSSVEDCLRWLWPKLQEGCKFYSHEPWSVHVVSLFYDREWWNDNLNSDPPVFYGSGNGTKIGLQYSGMGYSQKYDAKKIVDTGNRIVHPGLRVFK